MIKGKNESNITRGEIIPKEGEIYRVLSIFGEIFELRYGYYEECDRQNPLCDPVPIYPDFIREPRFTKDGDPFVTMMQDVCEHFASEAEQNEDNGCADCDYFIQGEEMLGICTCKRRNANR